MRLQFSHRADHFAEESIGGRERLLGFAGGLRSGPRVLPIALRRRFNLMSRCASLLKRGRLLCSAFGEDLTRRGHVAGSAADLLNSLFQFLDRTAQHPAGDTA